MNDNTYFWGLIGPDDHVIANERPHVKDPLSYEEYMEAAEYKLYELYDEEDAVVRVVPLCWDDLEEWAARTGRNIHEPQLLSEYPQAHSERALPLPDNSGLFSEYIDVCEWRASNRMAAFNHAAQQASRRPDLQASYALLNEWNAHAHKLLDQLKELAGDIATVGIYAARLNDGDAAISMDSYSYIIMKRDGSPVIFEERFEENEDIVASYLLDEPEDQIYSPALTELSEQLLIQQLVAAQALSGSVTLTVEGVGDCASIYGWVEKEEGGFSRLPARDVAANLPQEWARTAVM